MAFGVSSQGSQGQAPRAPRLSPERQGHADGDVDVSALAMSPREHPNGRSMPEIRRASIVSSRIDRRPLRRLWAWITGSRTITAAKRAATRTRRTPGWRRTAVGRRLALVLLVLAQSGLAAWSLERTFPHPELSALEIATLGVFSILWIWISFGYWTAMVGFKTQWRRSLSVSDLSLDHNEPLRSRTAIVV